MYIYFCTADITRVSKGHLHVIMHVIGHCPLQCIVQLFLLVTYLHLILSLQFWSVIPVDSYEVDMLFTYL